jgi:hypothetical protein
MRCRRYPLDISRARGGMGAGKPTDPGRFRVLIIHPVIDVNDDPGSRW